MKRHVALVLTVLCLPAADNPKEDPIKKELAKVQGAWALEMLEINGQVVAEEELNKFKLVVKDTKWTLTIGDQVLESTVLLDPAQKPKTIDLTANDGQAKGKTTKGIYELEDDKIKICRHLKAEKDRPTEFHTQPDSGLVLGVWKRAKP